MTNTELQAARMALRMHRTAMAKALGVSRSTYNTWEKGEARIPHAVELALETLRRNAMSGPIEALAADAYNRITLADRTADDLRAIYAENSGFVEWSTGHGSLVPAKRREISAFSADEIGAAIALAEEWATA